MGFIMAQAPFLFGCGRVTTLSTRWGTPVERAWLLWVSTSFPRRLCMAVDTLAESPQSFPHPFPRPHPDLETFPQLFWPYCHDDLIE